MNYSDIRHHVQEHYRALLRSFKAEVSVSGPVEGQRLDTMAVSRDFIQADPDAFLQTRLPRWRSGPPEAILRPCGHPGGLVARRSDAAVE